MLDDGPQDQGSFAGGWTLTITTAGTTISDIPEPQVPHDGGGVWTDWKCYQYGNGERRDFTPLSGSGTLFELRMTRVSKVAQSTQLIWSAAPDQFIFIDTDLNTQTPGYTASGSVKSW